MPQSALHHPPDVAGQTGQPPQNRLQAFLTDREGERLGLILLMLWALYAWIRFYANWGNDLGALWFAGYFHATGQDALIYATPPHFFGGAPEQWDVLASKIGLTGKETAFPYIYPPLWVEVLAPMTKAVSPRTFQQAFLFLNIVSLVGCALLAEQIARPARMSRLTFRLWSLAVLSLSTPVIGALWLNQPSIIVAFLILLTGVLIGRRPVIAGAVLAVATAIKLTPMVFVILLLQGARSDLPGALRGLVSFGLCSLVLVATSILMVGWPLHHAFLDQLNLASRNSVWAAMNPSPRLVLNELIGLLKPSTSFNMPTPVPDAWLIEPPRWVGIFMALIALPLAARAATLAAKRRGAPARALAMLGLSIGLFLFGPLSWLHYLIVPIFLAPALASGLSRIATAVILALILLANTMLTLQFFTDLRWHLLPYSLLIGTVWAIALAATFRALANQPRS